MQLYLFLRHSVLRIYICSGEGGEWDAGPAHEGQSHGGRCVGHVLWETSSGRHDGDQDLLHQLQTRRWVQPLLIAYNGALPQLSVYDYFLMQRDFPMHSSYHFQLGWVLVYVFTPIVAIFYSIYDGIYIDFNHFADFNSVHWFNYMQQ